MTASNPNEQKTAALKAEIERLEHALSRAEQRYNNLFENIGDSVFVVDLASYTILNANRHAARRLGYSRDELIGMSLEDIEVIPEGGGQDASSWESSFSGTYVFECEYRHHDGYLIPVEVSSRVVEQDGNTVLQNFVRSITHRKAMEAERQQMIDDLESFDHTVAHDLKNPLSTLMGFAVLMEEAWEELSPEEVAQYLGFIASNSRRAINIVESLLVFASVRKQEEISFEALDMAAIVAEVQERFAFTIADTGAQLHLPERWETAVGYAPWVTEVWANYVSNAIKYGGTPPQIELGSEALAGGMVRFWVRDNGNGIPADELPRLFSAYRRLGEMRIQGHGLGLSIAKRIVERLGGEVGVESQEGQGSSFSFTLPAANTY